MERLYCRIPDPPLSQSLKSFKREWKDDSSTALRVVVDGVARRVSRENRKLLWKLYGEGSFVEVGRVSRENGKLMGLVLKA